MPVRICVLKSGSSGNCTAIWSRNGVVLIDCGGIRLKYFEEHLRSIGLTPGHVRGIVISHAHGDHLNDHTVRISKEYDIPIYVHRKTYRAKGGRNFFDGRKNLTRHYTERAFSLAGFTIRPFRTKHGFYQNENAGLPFGFCITRRGRRYKIGYITDTQYAREVRDAIAMKLKNCSCLIIEANHSREKIDKDGAGFSNWRDHLSNESAAKIITQIMSMADNKNVLRHVFLAHISSHNNSRRYIKKEIYTRLKRERSMPRRLITTNPDERSRVYTIV